MNKTKFFLISFVFFIVLVLLLYRNQTEIRIQIKIPNLTAYKIDSTIADDISKELSLIKNIHTFYIFSKNEICNVYCLLSLFCFNKEKIIDKIQNRLFPIVKDFPYETSILIDDKYNYRYDNFLFVFSKNSNYKLLKDVTTELYDEILSNRVAIKAINFGEQKRAIYLNFKNAILKQYEITLDELLKLIKENISPNFLSIKNVIDNKLYIKTNFSIQNIEDIAKIRLNFKNKDFSILFDDVFDLKEDTILPYNELVFYNFAPSQLIAYKTSNFFSKLKINKILKKYKRKYSYFNFEVIDTARLEKITLFFNDAFGINTLNNEKNKLQKIFNQKNIKDVIYFLGCDGPKINNSFAFFENDDNKIVLLVKKRDKRKAYKLLKDYGYTFLSKNSKEVVRKNLSDLDKEIKNNFDYRNNFSTYRGVFEKFQLNNNLINKYQINNSDILNALYASLDGLKCCSFYNDLGQSRLIILKNLDNMPYVFSKKYNSLINLDYFLSKEIEYDYHSILRKNNNYCSILYK